MDQKTKKAAVIVWAYHSHIWDEFFELLKPLNNQIKLYLGICQDKNNNTIIQNVAEHFPDFHVQEFRNCGVDVRPFLYQLSQIDPEQHPIFLKIHTKESLWGFKNHVNWRAVLVHSIIGSSDIFRETINTLSDPNNCIVCNKCLLLENREFKDNHKIKDICRIIGIKHEDLPKKRFCGGNIFAGKTKLYQKYFNGRTIPEIDDYLKAERNKVSDRLSSSGTYSHSLERIFGYIADNENMNICHNNLSKYKIYNAEHGMVFNLVVNYDKSCYIEEDLNVYGHIADQTKKSLLIKWLHTDSIYHTSYKLMDDQTFVKETQ